MSLDLRALADRVADYLGRMETDTETTDEGIFFFKHGSTVLMVSAFEQDNHRWVRFVATMLADVAPSMELLARLLRMNTDVLLGAFLLFEDGTLAFSYTLLGDHLDFEEFEYALTYVARVGDDYDEDLQALAGGRRAEDILLGG